jgi:hypothetical protein
LIGVVVGFPIEDIHTESALLQAIEPAIESCLHDMPQKTATFLTSMKVMALEDPFELG